MRRKQTKVEKYKLFAAICNADTMRIALETPYSRVSNGYILLYKQGDAPAGYKEMTPEILEILTDDEKKWLKDVNLAIIQLFLQEHKEEARKGMLAFGKRFERELQSEVEKRTEAAKDAQQEANNGSRD